MIKLFREVTLMKKATKVSICVALSLLLCILVYMIFIRHWQLVVNADSEIDAMRGVTVFEDKGLADQEAVLSKIDKAFENDPKAENTEDDFVKQKSDFRRSSALMSTEISEYSKPYLIIRYSFGDDDTRDFDNTSATVYIFAQPDFSYSFFSGPEIDLPDDDPPFGIHYAQPSPVLRALTKHRDEGRFRYFVSPVMTGWDYFFWPSKWGGTVYFAFVYGDYAVYIEESSLIDVKYYNSRYKDVVLDLVEVLNSADSVDG